MEEIVPLAWDYNCDKLEGDCARKFRSIMSPRSRDITVYLKKHIDSKNFLNYESSI
jgi:hypothetical protein